MELKNVVYLLFLIVWIVVAVLNKKKAADRKKDNNAPTPSQNRRPGFNLSSIFEQLKESAMERVEKPEPVPEPVIDINGTSVSEEEKVIQPDEKVAVSIEEPDVYAETTDINESIESEESHAFWDTERNNYPAEKHGPLIIKNTPSVRKLREAIVWSEILAKPVSMRE